MSKGSAIPCMEGGSGEESYASNSLPQNYHFHTFAKPHLSQALDHFVNHFFPQYAHTPCQYASTHMGIGMASTLGDGDASTHTGAPTCSEHRGYSSVGRAPPLQAGRCPYGLGDIVLQHHHNKIVQLNVADFGCSYGRNTLDYAAFIVQGLYKRLYNNHKMTPCGDAIESPSLDVEMQYLFSDLPSNNFNALFQSLQPFLQEQLQRFDAGRAPLKWKLFSGAVAGSFHAQLFPTASLHLAISAYALHWLSQVPPEVVDKASPAWNGGHIWLHGARPRVVEAYANQFQKDMKIFLLNRAKEIVNGGILFLLFPCRAQKYPQGAFFTPHHDIWTGCYESTWEEMVLEGLVRKEEMDMFNIPFYNCHVTEMQEALDELSNDFKVVKMEVMRDCSQFPKEEEQKIMGDPQAFGKFVANFVASLMKPMVQEYLDESRANELFQRLQTQAARKVHLSTSMSYDMLLAIIQRL